MARRRMHVADIKEILVGWDAGENVSAIAARLGYTRPTVRKYVRAAERVGLVRGGGQRGEEAWEALTGRAMAPLTPDGSRRDAPMPLLIHWTCTWPPPSRGTPA